MTTERQAVSLIKRHKPVLDAEAVAGLTDDQLHGRQCWQGIDCLPPFRPAGHAYTAPAEPGAPLGWAVVACERHGGTS